MYYENFDQFLLKVKNANYMIYGTFLHEDNSTNLSEITFKQKNAFYLAMKDKALIKSIKIKLIVIFLFQLLLMLNH